MILRSIVIAIISLTASRASAATMVAPALALVDEFPFAVEPLDDVSKECGITKDLIESAIRYPILKTGLKIARQSNAILDVNMVSERLGSICYTSYSLGFIVYAPVTYKGKSFLGDVELWSAGGYINSPMGMHASRMRDQLEQLAKDLVVNWSQVKSGDYPYPPPPGSIPH